MHKPGITTYRITHRGGYFALGNTEVERELAKRARWRWHGRCASDCGPCSVRLPHEYWWTNDEQHVVDLLVAAAEAGIAQDALEFGEPGIERRIRQLAEPRILLAVPLPPAAPASGPALDDTPVARDFRRAAAGDLDD